MSKNAQKRICVSVDALTYRGLKLLAIDRGETLQTLVGTALLDVLAESALEPKQIEHELAVSREPLPPPSAPDDALVDDALVDDATVDDATVDDATVDDALVDDALDALTIPETTPSGTEAGDVDVDAILEGLDD